MITVALFLWQFATPVVPVDSARVESSRLVVEPVGLSFEIPNAWLTRVQTSGGPTCDLHSAQARSINTERTALRSMTGPSSYFGDQYYSAFADSVFPVNDLVAHLGGLGWRDCDSSVNDLQMRVYVGDASPESIAVRVATVRLSPYRGYSVPTVAAARDSAGWHIEQVDWEFNCGDCIFRERLEIYSRRIASRTVSLVFMYMPMFEREAKRGTPQRISDLQTIVRSVIIRARGGACRAVLQTNPL